MDTAGRTYGASIRARIATWAALAVAGLSGLVLVITSIWGGLLSLGVVVQAAGFWGFLAAVFVLPLTLVVAPLYAGLAWHDWLPALVGFGGLVVAAILRGVAEVLGRVAERWERG